MYKCALYAEMSPTDCLKNMVYTLEPKNITTFPNFFPSMCAFLWNGCRD